MNEPDQSLNLLHLLAVARGESPADLLLKNGRILNVFSGEIESNDIAIFNGLIAGLGPGYSAKESIDLTGSFVAPGLIDAHVHIESSLCVPAHFASAVLPRGVTTVVTDPHEIANVAGAAGVRFMADSRRDIPLHIEILAPSCVPATPMGSSGAALGADDLSALLADGIVRGLAEVMNFPDVIHGAAPAMAKLHAFAGKPIDGHCPNVRGRQLNAYIASGIGSDHESVVVEEAKEKLSRGLYIFIREATNARNLQALLPLVTKSNSRRFCFCTDDRQPADLLGDGGIDFMVRQAIVFGLDPVDVFRMATLNTAEYFGLNNRGAISPGRSADLMVFDDLKQPRARLVFASGKSVTDYQPNALNPSTEIRDTCSINWSSVDFQIKARTPRIRVIGAMADQLATEHRVMDGLIQNGFAIADPKRDLLKMAVVERHRASGNIGLGFIHGFSLQRGAIAGTVAHDHHNLVIIGADDISMMTAAKAAAENGGGLAVADGQTVLAVLQLPVAGLMSLEPIGKVRQDYQSLLTAAANLGSQLHDPFMAMSFMALEVIPSLKLTDQGLVDVEKFQKVDLFV